MNEIHRRNKTCIILSNSSQRSSFTHDRFCNLGFNKDTICNIVTSGESTYKYLKESKKYKNKKVFLFSWKDYDIDTFILSLNELDITITDSIDDADFLLFHGSQRMSNGNTISLYDNGMICDQVHSILKRAKERDLPAICANLDLDAINPEGRAIMMPGRAITSTTIIIIIIIIIRSFKECL